ncbi:MAG: lysoplasmalogenase [Lachnospiraceae bacterium]|nr:lysoplasmalogenase [Lachnospiraceae bacterium]
MLRIFLFCLLGQLLPAFLLYAEEHRHMKAALVLKTLSSLFFVLLGFFLMKRCPDPRYARLVMAGLVFGMIGDVLLNVCHLLKNDRPVFVAGGLVFFLGHVMYIAALIPAAEGLLPGFLCTLCFALPAICFAFVKTSPEPLRIPAVLYLLTVSLFAGLSAAFFWKHPELSRARLVSLGAVLFLLSDTFLIRNMFRQDKSSLLRILLMVFYYLGQTLIALSLG